MEGCVTKVIAQVHVELSGALIVVHQRFHTLPTEEVRKMWFAKEQFLWWSFMLCTQAATRETYNYNFEKDYKNQSLKIC